MAAEIDSQRRFSFLQILGEFSDAFMLRIIATGSDDELAPFGQSTLSALRARQLKAILSLTPVMVVANIISSSALVLVAELVPSPRFEPILWWFLVLFSGLFLANKSKIVSQRIGNNVYSSDGTGAVVCIAFVLALIWTFPLLSFTTDAGPFIQSVTLALTGVMIASGTIALFPIPLAAFVYTATLAIAAISAIMFTSPEHITSWLVVALAFFAVTFRAVYHHSKVFISELVSLLQMSEKRTVSALLMRQYEENSDNWVWECDEYLRLTNGVEIFAKKLQIDEELVHTKQLPELLAASPEQNGFADVQMLDIAMTSRVAVSGLVVCRWDGNRQQYWKMHALPQHDHEGNFIGYLGFTIDVTREEAATKRIEFLATRDALTGLLNKSEFRHRMSSQLNNMQQSSANEWLVSLAFMDSDGLKAVNDTFGHAAGDAMIMEIGQRLAKHTDRNSLIARVGGDEFLVAEFHHKMLPSQIVAKNVALTTVLSKPFKFDELEVKMSSSCGLSVSAASVADIDRMMQQADRALYHIKQHGGGACLLYEDRIGHPIARRRELSMEIGPAIKQKEIKVSFQAIVDTNNFTITGYEALARWTRSDGIDVPPEEFIVAAEESGQIVVLGHYILDQAIELALSWKDLSRVSVNISVLQLQYPEFVDELKEMLTRHAFPSERLLLEIVESNLLQTNTVVQDNLQGIRDLGIALAIDDFGKGYSSFAYLTEFPVSYLKIDRSITANLVESPEKQSIIRAIVGVALAFDVKTIAEGIETAEQFKIVRDLGCDSAQGYLIGLPKTSDFQVKRRVAELRPLLAAI